MTFLLTDELGRLVRWLRLMGADAELQPAQPRTALYRRAFEEQRVLVTRHRDIGASCLFRVVRLDSQELDEQLRQLVRELAWQPAADRRFTRCDRCNVPLEAVEKSAVERRVPPYVYRTQERFTTCPSCRRIYWAATHCDRAQRTFERLARGTG